MENTGAGEWRNVEYHTNFIFCDSLSLSPPPPFLFLAQAALRLGILSQHPE